MSCPDYKNVQDAQREMHTMGKRQLSVTAHFGELAHSLIVVEVSRARMQHEVGAVGGQRRGLGVEVRDLECHLIVHAKVAVVALLGGLALKGRRGHNDVLRGQGRQVGC